MDTKNFLLTYVLVPTSEDSENIAASFSNNATWVLFNFIHFGFMIQVANKKKRTENQILLVYFYTFIISICIYQPSIKGSDANRLMNTC